MRIAMTGYFHPFGVGTRYGAEREIWYLAEEFIKAGHDVTIFSVKGCNTPGCDFVEMIKPWDDNVDVYRKAINEYENLFGKFDVVQSYMASGKIDVDYWNTRKFCMEPFFQAPAVWNKVAPNKVIAYSKLLNSRNGGLGHLIYFGIPEVGEPELKADDYLVWVGRIDPGKAPHLAVEAAKRAGKRIILMGPAYHYPYFYDNIWPHIDGDKVVWLQGVDDEIKARVFKKAKAFLFPNWNEYHEMLGIVALESLRAGVPVIGWGHKDQPSAINYEGGEIIKHGKEGFIIEYNDYNESEKERTIQQAVKHINELDNISRQDCYNLFKNRFTAKIMADNHLEYYKRL